MNGLGSATVAVARCFVPSYAWKNWAKLDSPHCSFWHVTAVMMPDFVVDSNVRLSLKPPAAKRICASNGNRLNCQEVDWSSFVPPVIRPPKGIASLQVGAVGRPPGTKSSAQVDWLKLKKGSIVSDGYPKSYNPVEGARGVPICMTITKVPLVGMVKSMVS